MSSIFIEKEATSDSSANEKKKCTIFVEKLWWHFFTVMSVCLPVNVLFVDQQITFLYGNITTSLINPF